MMIQATNFQRLGLLGGLGLALSLGGCSGDDSATGESATDPTTTASTTTGVETTGESATDPTTSTTTEGTTASTTDPTTTDATSSSTTTVDTDTETGGVEMHNYAALVRGGLYTDNLDEAQKYHDMLAAGGEDAAKMLGDFGHDALLGSGLLGTAETAFLGLDRWDNLEGMGAFYSNPDFAAAFGMLFDDQGPTVETFMEVPEWHTWGDMLSGDAYPDYWFVVARGTLADSPEVIKPVHDMVAAGGEEMVKAAGDVAHVVFLGIEDPKQFLAIDIWSSDAAIEAVYTDPNFAAAFGMLFEPGSATIGVYRSSAWHQW